MNQPEVPDHLPDWVVRAAQIPAAVHSLAPDAEAWLLMHLEALAALLVRAGAGRQALEVLSGLFMDVQRPGPEPGGPRL